MSRYRRSRTTGWDGGPDSGESGRYAAARHVARNACTCRRAPPDRGTALKGSDQGGSTGGTGGTGTGDPATGGGASLSQALRPFWMQSYLPNLLLATGQGAMLPVLVYAARQDHGSPASGAVVVALNGFGTMLFDLPAGRILARHGERNSTVAAAALLAGGLAGCIVATSVAVLAAAVVVQAMGWALWGLVRLAHLSRTAPAFARGRAIGLFGGVLRTGSVLGPLLFLAVAPRTDVTAAFVIYLICVVVGFAWSLLAQDRADEGATATRAERVRPVRVIVEHRRTLLTAGVGSLGISVLRGSRNAIVPLWAAHIGLDAHAAASIFALSSVVDLALFFPAGVLSDRYGRRAVALPCLCLLSLGHLLVPFTHSYDTLFAAAFVLGLGNSLGAGIIMTMGADRAPEVGRASFLSVWRLISDGGLTFGPLVDSGVVALGAIELAGPVVAALGLASAVIVALFLEEPAHLQARVAARRR